jgi:membrane protease YdiL (CAAX protease family)
MIKKILKRVRLPEPNLPPWGLRLPIGNIVMFLVALFLGLLITTTIQDDDIGNPQAPALIMGGAIGSVMALTLAYQYASGAVLKKQEASKSYKQTVAEALGLIPSQSRPLVITALAVAGIAIAVDTIALLFGKPDTSLPIGLDRIDGANTLTWIVAAILFIVIRPAAEEIVFRGMLYPVLTQRFSDNLMAVGVSAVIFALFYFIQAVELDFNWQVTYWSLIYPLILGFTAGIVRAHTKSTLSAISANAMFGVFLIFKTILTVS